MKIQRIQSESRNISYKLAADEYIYRKIIRVVENYFLYTISLPTSFVNIFGAQGQK